MFCRRQDAQPVHTTVFSYLPNHRQGTPLPNQTPNSGTVLPLPGM